MHAVALSKYCKPSEYDLATVPTPKITKPDELLIKVRAASINPVDVKLASGLGKFMEKSKFPYKIGYDLAGTIVGVGSSVSTFEVGDEVYSRVPNIYRGTLAEYAISVEAATALKPKSATFTQAASIPLAGLTAYQSLQAGANKLHGLEGKTVFIPGGLSATGSFGVQLAKAAFEAGKVITTLSTAKIPKLPELIGQGVADQIVDYTKENIIAAVGKGTVDYMFDPVQGTLGALPLMKKNGVIVSISTIPSGTAMKQKMPDIATVLRYILDLGDWVLRTWASWHGVRYSYLFMHPDGEHLKTLAELVDSGKLKPVIGMTAKLSDIEQVRKGCQQVFDGKGGIGKFVVEID